MLVISIANIVYLLLQMLRTYLRKKKRDYDDKDIQLAVEAVREGTEVAIAAKTLKVPRSTLRDKLSGRRQSAKRPGVKTVFATKQEPALVDRLLCMSDRGFPLTSCIFFLEN